LAKHLLAATAGWRSDYLHRLGEDDVPSVLIMKDQTHRVSQRREFVLGRAEHRWPVVAALCAGQL